MINYKFGIVLLLTMVVVGCSGEKSTQATSIPDDLTAIDSVSGLAIDENLALVRAQCTACHSAKLITQNAASREGWEQMIRWMQQEQGLWDLGANEPAILDYLSKHYGVKKKGRRQPLTDIEWYPLKE